MKKLFSTILVICSLLGGNAFAEIIKFKCSDNEGHLYNFDLDKNSKILVIHEKYNTWEKFKTTKLNISFIDDKKLKIHNGKTTWNYGTNHRFGNLSLNCNDSDNSKNSTSNFKTDITFNIKQKREQCEAIGFEPETEKFADCVLRLVELDVKNQQNNKIVSAESSGNQALVDELKKQRDFESTQYLLNLGKELRNPQSTNSNIYMPQTQRCTIQGFGTFAKMVCR